MFENFLKSIAAKMPFEALMWLIWGSFIAIFILVVTLCLCLPNVRLTSKKPYLCLVYAYTAVTFALFLTASTIEEAAFIACLFWLAGYLSYGILCALTRKKKKEPHTLPAQVAACAAPVLPAQTIQSKQVPSAPPKAVKPAESFARNNVRLDHAIAVTNKLLQKNLGKTDRQELEKLKNTLEVMKVKGTLSPAEGEILNENFNTLLKLMAKYNV